MTSTVQSVPHQVVEILRLVDGVYTWSKAIAPRPAVPGTPVRGSPAPALGSSTTRSGWGKSTTPQRNGTKSRTGTPDSVLASITQATVEPSAAAVMSRLSQVDFLGYVDVESVEEDLDRLAYALEQADAAMTRLHEAMATLTAQAEGQLTAAQQGALNELRSIVGTAQRRFAAERSIVVESIPTFHLGDTEGVLALGYMLRAVQLDPQYRVDQSTYERVDGIFASQPAPSSAPSTPSSSTSGGATPQQQRQGRARTRQR